MRNINLLLPKLIIVLVFLIGSHSWSQSVRTSVDYGNLKSRNIIQLETVNAADSVLIYSKRFVEIYLKQTDIKEQLKLKRYSKIDSALLTVLNAKKKTINIIDQNFSYSTKEADSIRFARKLESLIEEDAINQIIESVGFDLILAGKFSLYSLPERKFLKSGIRGGKVKGRLGNRWYVLSLPGSSNFMQLQRDSENKCQNST
ncbi:MAG: hypothetical protein JST48_01615 [Bacteroidetes bacterium]|nr:hypothetical protein [Bacteroidota bacterium]